MAQRTWVGNAQRVRGITTITLTGTWAAADTVWVEVNGKRATFVLTGTSTTDAAAGLAQAVQGLSAEPEYGDLQSVVAEANVLTVEFPDDGTPVTLTSGRTGAGVVTQAVAAAPTGPNWWDNVRNWLEGAVPVAGDDVTFGELSQAPAKFGLPGAAVAYAKLEFLGSFAQGQVGLPAVNENGYPEYRPQYLLTSCLLVSVGEGSGVGPALVKIDSGGTGAVVVTVFSTDVAVDGDYAVHWKGPGASSTLTVTAGTVRLAPQPGDAATLASLTAVRDESAQASRAAADTAPVYAGSGAVVAALVADGLDVEFWGSLAEAEIGSATLTLRGRAAVSGACTAHEDGTLKHLSSGAGGTLILDAGTFDATGDPRPHHWATMNLYADAVVNDPDGTLIDGGWPATTLVECGAEDVTMNVGQNLTVSFGHA